MSFYDEINKICKKHKKVGLFVDMDGTIAEYKVFQNSYFKENPKGVFLNAKPLNIVIDKLRKINEIENLTIYILSLSKSNVIVEEKIEWLQKYAPFIKKENYIIINKEKGEYTPENREVIKYEKMKKKLDIYDYVILLDDDHKILLKTKEKLQDKGETFHISSAIV